MFIIPPFVAHSCRAKAKTNYAILSISDGDLIDRDELLSDLKRVNIDPKRVIELIGGVRDRKLNIGDLISDLLAYIDEESVNGLTIAQIAKKAGYSADHISRLFKNAIGISPRQYVIQERIRKSKRRAKEELISEIAQYSGFYDQSHFIRHFKRYEGVTPKEYYRSLR
jgi:AraC-like DNA-binding protein